MSTLILTDIHGNLPALEAILAHPAAQGCGRIVSLGDHVNFGPQSRAVHDRLTALGAVMLLGNHEERLLHPEDRQFDGYNWRLMRFTARQMAGIDLSGLPTDLRLGSALLTHGTPGDPYHLIQPWEVPALLPALPEGVSLLISGHNHTPWDVQGSGRRWVNPGSAGMRELAPGASWPDAPGVAPFLVLDGDALTHHTARYDVSAVARAFIETGAAAVAPELCRAVLHVMQTAQPQGASVVIRHVNATAAAMGLTLGDEAAWNAADLTCPWSETVPSPEYWKQLEAAL
ncbi:MAG: metallophosphoesterase family protein [Clostridia bacterium]|nr:metallophosphoesterase family protein [Clostridia bacterium]